MTASWVRQRASQGSNEQVELCDYFEVGPCVCCTRGMTSGPEPADWPRMRFLLFPLRCRACADRAGGAVGRMRTNTTCPARGSCRPDEPRCSRPGCTPSTICGRRAKSGHGVRTLSPVTWCVPRGLGRFSSCQGDRRSTARVLRCAASSGAAAARHWADCVCECHRVQLLLPAGPQDFGTGVAGALQGLHCRVRRGSQHW